MRRMDWERVWMWIAWRLPPGLVYWCAIRVHTFEPKSLTREEFTAWESCPERKCRDAMLLWKKYAVDGPPLNRRPWGK